jgi:hypothetical protein
VILSAFILLFIALQSNSDLTGKRIGTLNDIEVEIYTTQDEYTLGEDFTATVYLVNARATPDEIPIDDLAKTWQMTPQQVGGVVGMPRRTSKIYELLIEEATKTTKYLCSSSDQVKSPHVEVNVPLVHLRHLMTTLNQLPRALYPPNSPAIGYPYWTIGGRCVRTVKGP